MNRRDFHRVGTLVSGGLAALALAVPGAGYVLDALRQKAKSGGFRPLAKLNELKVGVPVLVPVVEERQDAWVQYPPEPVGAVWLVRQPEGAKEPVVAFTSACPHLGCAVNLSADRCSFYCACHSSNFGFDGTPKNSVPPRAMDALETKLSTENHQDAVVMVKFQRFRPQAEEKIAIG
jgi:menaquinol-cytochrome c reductase iron-sulfur subunit